jgi:ribosome biogenesis protein ERB1
VQIRSIAPDSTGQWLLTGGDDGSVRLWEVLTGRCQRVWEIGARVSSVAWCPDASSRLISCTSANHVILLDSGVGPSSARERAAEALKPPPPPAEEEGGKVVARWEAREDGGMQIVHNHQVRSVNWHSKCVFHPLVCSCDHGYVSSQGHMFWCCLVRGTTRVPTRTDVCFA